MCNTIENQSKWNWWRTHSSKVKWVIMWSVGNCANPLRSGEVAIHTGWNGQWYQSSGNRSRMYTDDDCRWAREGGSFFGSSEKRHSDVPKPVRAVISYRICPVELQRTAVKHFAHILRDSWLDLKLSSPSSSKRAHTNTHTRARTHTNTNLYVVRRDGDRKEFNYSVSLTFH